MSEAVARYKSPSRPPPGNAELLELAKKLAEQARGVVELIASAERFFLRDQLERKSSSIPQLVKQALACDSGVERRAVFMTARRVTRDCLAVFEVLARTHEASALRPAQATANALIDALTPLAVPPPLTKR